MPGCSPSSPPVFKILEPFIRPIVWALLLAFLLFPVNQAARRALRGRRGGAAILLTLGVVFGIVGPSAFLAVAFANQASDLFGRLQAVAGEYHVARLSDLLRVPIIDRVVQWAQRVAPVTAEQIDGWVVNAAKTLLQFLVATSGSVVVGALGTLVGLLVMLFLLFFFLRDGEDAVQQLMRLIPMDAKRQSDLLEHLSAVTRAVVFGSLVTALVQGTLVGISFALVGLPSPLVFGVLAAVASLVPLFGTALIWAPGAVALAFQQRWGAALFVLIWSLAVVATADNFIRPFFISGRAQISTLPVFLGLAGGLTAFGLIGLVLGPVIVALALALIRFAEQSRSGNAEKPG